MEIVETCTGRVVRHYSGYAEHGTVQMAWDLKTDTGAMAPGGGYTWYLRTSAGTGTSGRITVVPYTQTATAAPFTGGISADGFVPITPTRVYDSRDGKTQPLGQQSSRAITVRGMGQVPSSGVSGVAMNVTAVCGTDWSFLQAYPSGGSLPVTSVSNFTGSEAVPALVVAPLGSDGTVTLYNAVGSVHLVVDVVGYFPTSGGSTLKQVAGTRLLDGWASPMASGQSRTLPVASALGVPSSSVTGAVVNVTVAGAEGVGFVQLSPGAASTTTTSTVNYSTAKVATNRALVAVRNGQLTVTNTGATARVIVDVVGYFTGDGGGARYSSITPARVLDTRFRVGASGPLGAGQSLSLPVTGRSGVPSDAAAVLGTLTSDRATSTSYLTVWPSGAALPPTSDLNPTPGFTQANAVLGLAGQRRKPQRLQLVRLGRGAARPGRLLPLNPSAAGQIA